MSRIKSVPPPRTPPTFREAARRVTPVKATIPLTLEELDPLIEEAIQKYLEDPDRPPTFREAHEGWSVPVPLTLRDEREYEASLTVVSPDPPTLQTNSATPTYTNCFLVLTILMLLAVLIITSL